MQHFFPACVMYLILQEAKGNLLWKKLLLQKLTELLDRRRSLLNELCASHTSNLPTVDLPLLLSQFIIRTLEWFILQITEDERASGKTQDLYSEIMNLPSLISQTFKKKTRSRRKRMSGRCYRTVWCHKFSILKEVPVMVVESVNRNDRLRKTDLKNSQM